MTRMPTHRLKHNLVRMVRLLAVAVLALLAIWQITRQAYINGFAEADPARAAALWASHPDVAFKQDLEKIALAAAAKRPVPTDRISQILDRSKWAPLAPEPFLVRGVSAELAGQEAIAERAFLAAKRRDPRSVAARYFLADHFLRTGQPMRGLVELGALTRLVPGSLESLAPYYASYAKQPGGAARLKAMLRVHPDLESAILYALAGDPGNADLVVRLSSGWRDPPGNAPRWSSRLIESLLDAGQFAKARAIWLGLSTETSAASFDAPIFDPEFRGSALPPPFNWTLSSNGAGIAEAAGRGRLHLIYYGRDNAVLAAQTLLLKPGRYRLSFAVGEGSGDASALAWTLRCRPGTVRLISLSLGKGAPGRLISGSFAVVRDCPAQQLELVGTAPDFPETSDVTVGSLRLTRVGR
jgi:hypothetical protein